MDLQIANGLDNSILGAAQISSMPKFFEEGACVDKDPHLFDDDARNYDRAAEICSSCAVQRDCFIWAIENEEYGFWANTTAETRSTIRKTKVVDISRNRRRADKEYILASKLSNAEAALRLGCSKRTVIRARKKLRQEKLAS